MTYVSRPVYGFCRSPLEGGAFRLDDAVKLVASNSSPDYI